MRHRMSGVTLIELMIVMVIVGILTAIAYPSYRQQVLKSGRVEAKRTLMEAAQSLEKCFTRFGVYNSTNANCPALTNLRVGGVASEEGRYLVTTNVLTATTYTLQAIPQGEQADDLKCGTLTLDSVNTRDKSGTDTIRNCW